MNLYLIVVESINFSHANVCFTSHFSGVIFVQDTRGTITLRRVRDGHKSVDQSLYEKNNPLPGVIFFVTFFFEKCERENFVIAIGVERKEDRASSKEVLHLATIS